MKKPFRMAENLRHSLIFNELRRFFACLTIASNNRTLIFLLGPTILSGSLQLHILSGCGDSGSIEASRTFRPIPRRSVYTGRLTYQQQDKQDKEQ
jgi:hypothetical protein